MTAPVSSSSESESILSHRSFTLFRGARVASTIANQMQIVAVGWQVYQLTHSAFDLGTVAVVLLWIRWFPALFGLDKLVNPAAPANLPSHPTPPATSTAT
ncbi:hypothetical protein [Collimonas antrihumi]|uniref:hypothetical protein n=1 Tax=Collimonas antrihumi TaxID=1940615 RepID=UPI003CCE5F23